MAGWIDFISLFATIGICGSIVYGIVYATNRISEGIKSTKESLKTKGYDISDKGVSIKTSRRFDRESYVDATQRGMLKAMSASSFRRADSYNGADSPAASLSSPSPSVNHASHIHHVQRADSGSGVSVQSTGSGGKTNEKRKLFGRKTSV